MSSQLNAVNGMPYATTLMHLLANRINQVHNLT